MPVVSAANLTRLRTTRHATRLALAVYHPATLWSGQVNGAQATGATSITVDHVVQVKAPAKNFLVLFGSTSGGSDLGTARFKSYAAPTLVVGAHNTALADDTYVTIVEEIKPEAIHPSTSATDVVSEDGNVAYTNENLQYQPLARMGAPAVAYRDPVTGLATVRFYSRSTGIGGATIASVLWDVVDGVYVVGNAATAGTAGVPNVVTFATSGSRYVSLTATDSNGKTHTGYRPVLVYDHDTGTLPSRQIELSGLQGNTDPGTWSTRLTVYGTAGLAEFPANALCVVFAEDWFGDEAISIGWETWRENIVFVGYIRQGTAHVDRLHGSVDFELDSVSGAADNIWQLAGTLTTTAGSPTAWHTLKDMTYNLAAHHLLTQHSTVSQICDVYLNLSTYTAGRVDLTDASLAENLRQIAAATRGRVGCTAQGSLYLEINPQLQALASRSVSYILTTTHADLRTVDFGDELQEKQCPQVDFAGEDASANPVFSLAPATPWTRGRNAEKVTGIRVANQTEANSLAGLFEAYRNNSFGDVVMDWRGNYRCLDVYPVEPLAVTVAASDNTRGIAWTAQRCWIKSISYDYKPGILMASIVVEKDSYGSLGVTGNYPPVEPPVVVPPPIVEPPIVPPPEPPPAVPQGKGNLLYVSTLKGVAKCTGAYGTDGTDGAPVWTAINTGLAGDALKIRGFNLDPWSQSGDHFTAAWAMTDDGLYRCTGLPDAASWTKQLDQAAAAALIGTTSDDVILHQAFSPSVRLAGFVMCIVTQITPPTPGWPTKEYILWSLDYGATWNVNTSTGYINLSEGTTGQSLIAASYHMDGRYYIVNTVGGESNSVPSTYPSTTEPPKFAIFKSTALPAFVAGMSYGAGVGLGNQNVGELVFPYCDANGVVYTNDDTLYMAGMITPGAGGWTATGVSAIRRFTNAFTPGWSLGYAPIPGTPVGHADMTTSTRFVMAMFNENAMYAWGGNTLWTSSDGGSNWTKYTGMAVGGRGVNLTSMFNVPVDETIAFLTGYPNGGAGIARVGMTIDRGATWTAIDQQGLAGSLDTVLGLAAGDCAQSQIIVDYYKP